MKPNGYRAEPTDSLASDGLYEYNDHVPEEPLADLETPHRRWTVISSALLCLGLALVVLFTNRGAFFSPVAVMVVAAIGLAAVLLQVRFYNRVHSQPVHVPVWLNLLGIVFALIALFGDRIHLASRVSLMMALCAVGSFAVSSALVMHAFRKRRLAMK